MVDREKILSLLRMKGPLIPNDIKKALGGDTMIFGAMLSELASRGSVIISATKKGGSPLYYLPGQEKQLERFVDLLNPKDQKTIRLLQEEKVVRDKDLELFERVSLRQIKDFAKELPLNTQQGEQLFWRYYLVSKEDAIQILNDRYTPKNEEPDMVPEKQPEEVAVKGPTVEELQAQLAAKQQEVQQLQKEKETHSSETAGVSEDKSSEIPKPEVKVAPKVEVKPEPKPEPEVEKEKKVVQEEKPKQEELLQLKEQAKNEGQQKLSVSSSLEPTPFLKSVLNYFSKQEISILTESMISKDREYEFTVDVPSALGSLTMYCRARNKKKLNEGDVAPALLKAKTKDLPCFYLTNGEFTKKSLGIINKEYKGVLLKTL